MLSSFRLKMMDKEWTKLQRFSKEYANGVELFLDFAYVSGRAQGNEILCPCSKCRNLYWATRSVVYDHLIAKGFLKGYNTWVNHGESIQSLRAPSDDDMEDNIDGLLHDTFRNVVEGSGDNTGPNEEAKKFYKLINEAKQELYPGCQSFSSLSFIIRMYLLKCLHGWSNASFSDLLKLLKEAMPNLNIPKSFNKTKVMCLFQQKMLPK